jgi:hypothetical protein
MHFSALPSWHVFVLDVSALVVRWLPQNGCPVPGAQHFSVKSRIKLLLDVHVHFDCAGWRKVWAVVLVCGILT